MAPVFAVHSNFWANTNLQQELGHDICEYLSITWAIISWGHHLLQVRVALLFRNDHNFFSSLLLGA